MDDNMKKLNGGGLIALFRRYVNQFGGKDDPLDELNNYLSGKPVSEAFEAAAKEAELKQGEQR